MTDTYIFYTKKLPPTRVKAENELEACEKFYSSHPDFNLRDLLDIKVARKKDSKWLTHYKPHKKTEEHHGQM